MPPKARQGLRTVDDLYVDRGRRPCQPLLKPPIQLFLRKILNRRGFPLGLFLSNLEEIHFLQKPLTVTKEIFSKMESNMKLIYKSEELTEVFGRLMNQYNEYLWTVAWADFNFKLSDLLKKEKKRIKKLCVGLHFFGTKPDFLKEFCNHQGVRFIEQPTGTYHPKLYLFRNSDTEWELLIGSCNYTNSAFTNNTEVSVLISSSDQLNDTFYKDTIKFIDEQWQSGKILTEGYIVEYARKKKGIKNNFLQLPSQGILHPIFQKTWEEYLAELEQKDTEERINFLKWVDEQFSKQPHFHEMDKDIRKAIAGFNKDGYKEYGVKTGYFGTTDARGDFKKGILKTPEIITRAMSKIPREGEVTKSDYKNFISEFRKISKAQELACATRMLCLWRPDYFVNFNGENKQKMCNNLQEKVSKINYETYWDLVVERFISSSWNKEAQSLQNIDPTIYKYRMALLDGIFYEEK